MEISAASLSPVARGKRDDLSRHEYLDDAEAFVIVAGFTRARGTSRSGKGSGAQARWSIASRNHIHGDSSAGCESSYRGDSVMETEVFEGLWKRITSKCLTKIAVIREKSL